MKYTYQDMPDKSINGIRTETEKGLGRIAFYMFQTCGLPVENFIDIIKKKSFAECVMLYMNFRNQHPKEFEN